MPPKRSSVSASKPPTIPKAAPTAPLQTISRADQVRNLWGEFEVWHNEQLAHLDQRIEEALRQLDTSFQQTTATTTGKKKKNNANQPKVSTAEHQKRRDETRRSMLKTFDGNRVREEWQSRLDRAGLFDHDWDNITANEAKKVEKILGADLLEDEEQQQKAPGIESRTDSMSASTSLSDTYAFVDPTTLNVENENSLPAVPGVMEQHPRPNPTLDNWLEVRQRIKSDDEISLDASTTSSWGGGYEGAPAYMGWFSESRSSTQSSQTSLSGSPERSASKLPAPELANNNLLSSAVNRLSEVSFSWQNASTSSASTSNSNSTSSSTSSSSFPKKKKPSASRYIGPHIEPDPHDEVGVDEAALQFQEYKRLVRIQMIQEFHEEAAQADIELTLALDEANLNMTKPATKEFIRQQLEGHEERMLKLRQTKEEKRKEIVNKERERRLVEMKKQQRQPQHQQQQQQRHLQQSTPGAFGGGEQPQHRMPGTFGMEEESEHDFNPNMFSEKFLRELQFGPDALRGQPVSDTPTVRSQMNRTRLPTIQDWLVHAESGTDTPTPTQRSAGWLTMMKGSGAEPTALTDTPAIRRQSGLANAMSSALQESYETEVTPQAKSSKKTKEKSKPVAQSEVASSSKTKLEQLPPIKSGWGPVPKASSGLTLSSPLAPPPVPLATRPDIPATPLPQFSSLAPFNSLPPSSLSNMAFPGTVPDSISLSSSVSSVDDHQRWVPQSQAQTLPQMQMQLPADVKRPIPLRTVTEPPLPKAATQPIPIAKVPSTSKISEQTLSTIIEQPSSKGGLYKPNGKVTIAEPQPLPKTPSSKIAEPQPQAAASKMKKSKTLPNSSDTDKDNSKRGRKVSEPTPAPAIVTSANAKNAPAPTTTTTTTKKKGKKVTIEEVKEVDEEDQEDGGKRKEDKLPVDSRYIMEPKPLAATGMFSQILEFEDEERVPVKEKQKERETQKKDKQRVSEKEERWIPPSSSMSQSQLHLQEDRWIPPSSDDEGKHVRWTPNVAMCMDNEREAKHGSVEDTFLSGLDSLQKLMEDSGIGSGMGMGGMGEPRGFTEGLGGLGKGGFGELDRMMNPGSSVNSNVSVINGTVNGKGGKAKEQSSMFWNPNSNPVPQAQSQSKKRR